MTHGRTALGKRATVTEAESLPPHEEAVAKIEALARRDAASDLVEEAVRLLPELLGVRIERERVALVRAVITMVGHAEARDNVRNHTTAFRDTLSFLVRTRRVLCSLTEPDDALSVAARMAVPVLADACVVDRVGEGPSPRRALERREVVVDPRLPDADAIACALKENPPHPDAPYGPPLAIRTGEPTLVSEVSDDVLAAEARDARHLEILRGISPMSYVCVPIRAGSGVIGAIGLFSLDPARRYGPDEKEIAEDLAAHLGLVVARADPGAPTNGHSRPPLKLLVECIPGPRELEVLRLLDEGLTGVQIAAQLGLANDTIYGYIKKAKKKLGATTQLQAVAIARQMGLLGS
jgi:DNA-binding CsgD family transcriptional regulator/GAF domain-containing protein